MTAPTEPIDGGLTIDPAIARLLLLHREKVAQATEEFYLALRRLGVSGADAEGMCFGRRPHAPGI